MILTAEQELIMKGKVCPYCKKETKFVDSSIVYGKSYGMIYHCQPCDAYVGVHKDSAVALGRLANKNLRELKKEAHKYFDKIWKDEHLKRSNAYKWLSIKLDIPEKYTHIGMFSEKTCLNVIEYSKQFLNNIRRIDLDFGVETIQEYIE